MTGPLHITTNIIVCALVHVNFTLTHTGDSMRLKEVKIQELFLFLFSFYQGEPEESQQGEHYINQVWTELRADTEQRNTPQPGLSSHLKG